MNDIGHRPLMGDGDPGEIDDSVIAGARQPHDRLIVTPVAGRVPIAAGRGNPVDDGKKSPLLQGFQRKTGVPSVGA